MRRDLASVDDFRRAAGRRLPRAIADYLDGGAGEAWTVGANERAFRRYVFRPRVLTDVSTRDYGATILGSRVELPVFLGPSGMQRMVDREGEVTAARAAARAKAVYVLGVASSRSMEEVADAGRGARLWFQIHLFRNRATQAEVLQQARRAGYEALVVTVDSKSPKVNKYTDMRNGLSMTPFRLSPEIMVDAVRHPHWLAGFLLGPRIRAVHLLADGGSAKGVSLFSAPTAMDREMNPAAVWDEVRWLRGVWDGPLIVKGILTAEDATLACQNGADAIICSNHGGRLADYLPPTLRVLPRVAEVAARFGKELYMDGGVRSGMDVVKALALGAKACLIARPFWWAMAAAGEDGVVQLLDLYRREILGTMVQIGRASLADLDASAVEEMMGA